MEKEFKVIEEELKEICKFDNENRSDEVLSFSESCGGFITLICC